MDDLPRLYLRPTADAPLDQYDLERRRAVIMREALAPGMKELLPPWTGEERERALLRAAAVTLPPELRIEP